MKILEKDKIYYYSITTNKQSNYLQNQILCYNIDKNLIACHIKKTEVYFNKTNIKNYVGQAILDLSKTLMFDFRYNLIREKHGNKAELLFTDTDSLMYEIETEDFYKDVSKDVRRKFDTSDYSEKHPPDIKLGVNKKVIRKFKDEAAGKKNNTLCWSQSKTLQLQN